MDAKHTPGPWRIEQGINGGISYRGPAGEFVLDTGTDGGFDNEADTNLIAVAPDLLAALDAIVSKSKYGKAMGSEDCWLKIVMPTEEEMDVARAVLAKAKGGAA